MRPSEHQSARQPITPRRRAGLKVCRIDGEAVLYDAGQHAVYYLNDAALSIWAQTDDLAPRNEVFSRLPDDAGEIAEYVDSAVDAMIDAGLLERELPLHA